MKQTTSNWSLRLNRQQVLPPTHKMIKFRYKRKPASGGENKDTTNVITPPPTTTTASNNKAKVISPSNSNKCTNRKQESGPTTIDYYSAPLSPSQVIVPDEQETFNSCVRAVVVSETSSDDD